MSASVSSYSREYRPGQASLLRYLWDFELVACGILIVLAFRGRVVPLILGAFLCLYGAWSFWLTRHVLNTWILTKPDQIIKVHPNWHFCVRWSEITEVLIRERPGGLMPGRADRLVILHASGGRGLSISSSILAVEDEDELLSEIQHRVSCQVRKITDTGWSLAGWKADR